MQHPLCAAVVDELLAGVIDRRRKERANLFFGLVERVIGREHGAVDTDFSHNELQQVRTTESRYGVADVGFQILGVRPLERGIGGVLRPPSPTPEELVIAISQVRDEVRKIYGAPKTFERLQALGVRTSRKRVTYLRTL